MSDARGRGVARQVHSGGQAGGQLRPAGRKAKAPTAGWRQRFGFIIAFVLATLIGLWTCPYQTGHLAWLDNLLAMNSRGERMRKPECGWMLL
jgi:hypothetical protein